MNDIPEGKVVWQGEVVKEDTMRCRVRSKHPFFAFANPSVVPAVV